MNSKSGILYALIAAAGLGAVTTQAKFVYADGGNALTLMFWRFVVSALVIGLLVLVQRKPFRIPEEVRWPAILIGVIWSGSMVFYLQSVETISVSLAVLILYSYPILVLVISTATGKITLSGKVIVAFAIAFLGLVLMLSGGEMQANWLGISFAVLAAAGAAYTFLTGNQVATRMDPMALSFWVNVAGVVIIIPLIMGKFSMPGSSFALVMLGGATFSFVIAIVCQFQALARIQAARAAFVFNFEPVVSILLAALILGESLTLAQWSGAVMVIGVLFAMGKLMKPEGELNATNS